MINVKELKANLSSDDIILLLSRFDVDFNYQNSKEIHFQSVCHDSRSHKLYYYIENQNFFCHRCQKSWDIVSLLQEISDMTFADTVEYICEVLNIDAGVLSFFKKADVYDWRSDFMQYTSNDYKTECDLTIYDDNILRFFNDDVYPLSWLEEGISLETMQSYGIRYYPLHNSVVIPNFDDGFNLVGIRERFLNESDIEDGKYKPLTMLDGKTFKFPTSQIFYGMWKNQANIKRKKICWLVESEKSVMKFDTWYGADENVALAMYGVNLGDLRRNYILNLGVEEVVIMIDSDFHNTEDNEYFEFQNRIRKIANAFNGFIRVSVCYNNQKYDGYKFAPCDFSKEMFETLYENREYIK